MKSLKYLFTVVLAVFAICIQAQDKKVRITIDGLLFVGEEHQQRH